MKDPVICNILIMLGTLGYVIFKKFLLKEKLMSYTAQHEITMHIPR